MSRAVLMLLGAVVVLTTVQSAAHARRLVCEAEPAMSLGPDADRLVDLIGDRGSDRMGDDDDREHAPAPSERRVCLGGFSDDAGCWPDRPLPEPGRNVPLSFPDSLLLGSAPPLPARGVTPAPSPPGTSDELAPGHARRIERPPRSIRA